MAWHNILKENFHHYIDRLFNELLLVCNKSNASVSDKDYSKGSNKRTASIKSRFIWLANKVNLM